MNDGKRIDLSMQWFYAVVVFVLVLIATIWSLTLYIWGEKRHVAGYALGCEATKARTPAISYIDSGQTFCFDRGNYFGARKTGKDVFRVTK